MTHTELTANHLGALTVALWARSGSAHNDRSPTSIATLTSLAHREPMSIAELAEIVGTGHSNAVRLTDRLTDAGLVKKRRQQADRRAVDLSLTSTGRRVANTASKQRLAEIEQVLDCLAPDEQQTLSKLIFKVLSHLPTSTAEARSICRYCDHSICSAKACPVGEAARALEQEGGS